MPDAKPYILFCAGEDSGDCIGELLVKAAYDVAGLSSSVEFVGAGGPRMEQAGLKTLVDYETLPVSGFGDVVPKYLRLRQSFSVLKHALESPLCLGFVAIDYPGFNMKLMGLAGAMNKPSLYVAPPQVWAWKAKRAKQLALIKNSKLAVFFDFEKRPYDEAGCNVEFLQHPFVETVVKNDGLQRSLAEFGTYRDQVLLLPGSRKSQILRNVPVFLKIAERLEGQKFAFVAARESLLPLLKESVGQYFKGCVPPEIGFAIAPGSANQRVMLYGNAAAAVASPGTATLELALSGCSFIVATKPDVLTYALGKRFVKSKFLALPNIILRRDCFPEFVQSCWRDSDYRRAAQSLRECLQNKKDCAVQLRSAILDRRKDSEQLMSEFLAQFV